jgi:hypothetical protein
MKRLSMDLRERIIAAVDNRECSHRDIARPFRMDVSCIPRLPRPRRRTGSHEPGPHGGGSQPRSTKTLKRLRGLVHERPDATLEGPRQHLDLSDRAAIGDRSDLGAADPHHRLTPVVVTRPALR